MKKPVVKIKHIAIFTTSLVIIAGFAMIIPLFSPNNETEYKQKVMLCFNINTPESPDIIEWCQNLAASLDNHDIEACIFIVGEVADRYPQVVSCFGDKIDIGSYTYSHLNLTTVPDYSIKLQEVKEGKMAVDIAGSLYSRIFRAPYGATDQDIYSLLSRSDILADFSCENQYNVFHDGQFIKYDSIAYESSDYPPSFFSHLSHTAEPIFIIFNNENLLSDIDGIISSLKANDVIFVNASSLTGLTLTIRGDEHATYKSASN
jgi:hypothetical protein